MRQWAIEQYGSAIGERVFLMLRDKWGQINENTSVHCTHQYTIYVPGDMVKSIHHDYPTDWRSRWWRIVGSLFNRPKWFFKGVEQIPLMDYATHEIRLERFGATFQVRAELLPRAFDEFLPRDKRIFIACAYDPRSDRLYIYE